MTNTDASVNCAASSVQQNKPALQRQRTWDIDIETGSLDGEPRPSPPRITSSPAMVAELSQSLGQISLQSEIGSNRNVTEYILGAQQNLEKALKMLLYKNPSISKELSPNQGVHVLDKYHLEVHVFLRVINTFVSSFCR